MVLEALTLIGEIPEIRWQHGDDACDCTFQRIGWWTNPYLGRTLEVRLCCAWKKMGEMFPEIGQFVREIPAYDNPNTGQWETKPAPWDADHDMPEALWHRQLAIQQGKPVAQVRREYAHLLPPKGVRKEPLCQRSEVSTSPTPLLERPLPRKPAQPGPRKSL